MTNINCSSSCVYQQDGKCCYDSITSSKLSLNSDCAYFKEIETIKNPNTLL